MFAEVLEYVKAVEYISWCLAAYILTSNDYIEGFDFDNYRDEVIRLTLKLSRELPERTKQMFRGETRGVSNIRFHLINPVVER